MAATPDIPSAATVVLVRDGGDGIETLLLERPDHGAFARAWVFPGGRVDPEDAPDGDDDAKAIAAAVRETHEETGLRLAEVDLVALSQWTPPAQTTRKFRTWFFVAKAPDAPVTIGHEELVGYRWLTPADAIALHGEGALTLFPPTWVTLHDLIGHESVEALLEAVRGRDPLQFSTHHDDAARLFLWDGDEVYDGGAETDDGPRHRLIATELPWLYERR